MPAERVRERSFVRHDASGRGLSGVGAPGRPSCVRRCRRGPGQTRPGVRRQSTPTISFSRHPRSTDSERRRSSLRAREVAVGGATVEEHPSGCMRHLRADRPNSANRVNSLHRLATRSFGDQVIGITMTSPLAPPPPTPGEPAMKPPPPPPVPTSVPLPPVSVLPLLGVK